MLSFQNLPEILRKRSRENEAGKGRKTVKLLREGNAPGVKKLTCPLCLILTVFGIPDEGMSQAGQVRPDLVGASRDEPYL